MPWCRYPECPLSVTVNSFRTLRIRPAKGRSIGTGLRPWFVAADARQRNRPILIRPARQLAVESSCVRLKAIELPAV